jgi:hypothetical protein
MLAAIVDWASAEAVVSVGVVVVPAVSVVVEPVVVLPVVVESLVVPVPVEGVVAGARRDPCSCG